jgi:putative Holliday junction resolvase
MLLLGIDFGTKRIGLASGDSSLAMSFPLRSLVNSSSADVVAGVLAAAVEVGAEKIVVGIPHRMTGEEDATPGDTEERARAFIAALSAQTQLPIDTEDERMTSAYVDSVRRSVGGKDKDFDRDAVAAAAILETYMQRMGL